MALKKWLTTIDWAATGTMLQGVGTVIGAIAVYVAARIGSQTFRSWRRQKLTERHIEQSERILTATYKVRRGLSYIRSPAIWDYEINEAEYQLKENGEWIETLDDIGKNRLATRKLYYNRLNRTIEDRNRLEECQPMARALFGEELESAIEQLNRQFWIVQTSVDARGRNDGRLDDAFRHKIECAIWEGYPSKEENEVDRVIAAQVKRIEDICVPVIRLHIGR